MKAKNSSILIEEDEEFARTLVSAHLIIRSILASSLRQFKTFLIIKVKCLITCLLLY